MKKMLLKTICLLSLLGYAGVVSAACCDPCCPPPPKPQCEPCKACEICPPCEECKPCCTEVPKTGEPCNCAYSAPARIDPLCGWDVCFSLSFIYWQPKQKGLDVGFLRTESSTEAIETYDIMNLDTDYHPGFKVGAGLGICRDEWTLYLEYTRLSGDDTYSKDISNLSDNNDLIIGWLGAVKHSALSHYKYIKAKWDLSYNMFDLELGRPYYLGRKLIFKPHCGLRGGWIDQKYNVDAVSERRIRDDIRKYKIFARDSQDSWLVGPRAGLDTDWLIGCDFRIFANLAGSLTYQKFKTDTKETFPKQEVDIDPITLNALGKNIDDAYLTPNAELAIGLGYGSYFSNNQWYFDLIVGYDVHYFWKQNFMRRLKDQQVIPGDGDAGNLMLHGLTITARVDF